MLRDVKSAFVKNLTLDFRYQGRVRQNYVACLVVLEL